MTNKKYTQLRFAHQLEEYTQYSSHIRWATISKLQTWIQ